MSFSYFVVVRGAFELTTNFTMPVGRSACKRLRMGLANLPSKPPGSTSRLGGGQTARARHVLDQADDDRGPTGLVVRAESLARIAVEIFVEEHQVAPVRVFGPPGIVALTRAPAVG